LYQSLSNLLELLPRWRRYRFQKMAREVRLREEKLRKKLTELKIALDETRQKKKVAEITETDYFKTLRSESDSLRNIISGKTDGQG